MNKTQVAGRASYTCIETGPDPMHQQSKTRRDTDEYERSFCRWRTCCHQRQYHKCSQHTVYNIIIASSEMSKLPIIIVSCFHTVYSSNDDQTIMLQILLNKHSYGLVPCRFGQWPLAASDCQVQMVTKKVNTCCIPLTSTTGWWVCKVHFLDNWQWRQPSEHLRQAHLLRMITILFW